ncbi:pyridoxal phosphate-dependent transferase [Syncephalis fuscata]|nr:pyridoxal phosphate-dependent transferase [Syncephalis fuscata]
MKKSYKYSVVGLPTLFLLPIRKLHYLLLYVIVQFIAYLNVSMTTKAPTFRQLRATESIPPDTPHAVSVSLPTWQDNVDYEEGAPHIHNAIRSAYPRFVIHIAIRKLAGCCLEQLGTGPDKQCLLLPTQSIAKRCRQFIIEQRKLTNPTRVVGQSDDIHVANCTFGSQVVHVTVLLKEDWAFAKAFWQHTGDGISSRFAERCLLEAGIPLEQPSLGNSSTTNNAMEDGEAEIWEEANFYVEERYGRNLCAKQANEAKSLMQQRIANELTKHMDSNNRSNSSVECNKLKEDNVYLYPCGMSAIYNTHRLLRAIHPERKSVCFGFPYTDTLKILEKFGPGCLFFGYALEEDIDALEKQLADPAQERILAVFCEFPSNPLLRSSNLHRLRALANQYSFAIVVDATLGGFSDIEILPLVDIIVASLTKFFSGDCNVMGGCLVANPNLPYGARINHALNVDDGSGQPGYEDMFWWEDAIFLERNSRTFAKRVTQINNTAESLCDYLHMHPKVAAVYYPKYVTKNIYDMHKRPDGGYGGLFSLLLHTPEAARAFFDALPCAKGPSLGTNFTLACPYTLLAHYNELEWAAEYGVSAYLIRVSVGLEEPAQLRKWFDTAFAAVSDVPSKFQN